MIAPQHRISFAALALILSLAVPAGLLSLASTTTTGEQVDAADLIVAARVLSVQNAEEQRTSIVEFEIDHLVVGQLTTRTLTLTGAGRAPVLAGDMVLAMMSRRPAQILGIYQLRKNARSLEYEVVSPVTGMAAQGISGGGAHDPLPLPLVEAAILARVGGGHDVAPPLSEGTPGPADGAMALGGGVDPDAYESNDTLASATYLTGLAAPSLVTGNPLLVSGLTLTANDVDFFSFDSAALNILHAQTLEPLSGLGAPDTLMGLFDLGTAMLLAHDDDGGDGQLSKLVVPIEKAGQYAVAVESAPDTDLDFSGDEGTTIGSYVLSLELEIGSYIWNQLDQIAGVSPDGTFIEDLVGYKAIGGQDVLMSGVPADGWAVEYDVAFVGPPAGISHVYGGAGDQLTDPGFTNPLLPLSFELLPFETSAGINRRGEAKSSAMVTHSGDGAAPLGVVVTTDYTTGIGDVSIRGDLSLQMATREQILDLAFRRVMDVDLFGAGADEFSWSFDPSSRLKAFAVDLNAHVGNLTVPAQATGTSTGDMQAALLIEHGDSNGTGFGDITHYRVSFALVQGFSTAAAAHQEALRKLRADLVETWVIAVDQDPVTGLFAAFGTGLGEL